ncbi:hypothetical protein R3P38DRAFT_2834530 [Favolaschia claudopus]|uniref:F-box domain-containing protein n=1 Tax=Favolaschia claudopus TaxID=2862362 RepID=A0AAW0ED64_9AGAR
MSSPTSILSLPNELLVIIAGQYEQVPWGRSGWYHRAIEAKYRSEWVLSRLCRRLRNVVIGAPTLWTNITVIPNTFQRGSGLGEILRLYLQRSIPLKVSISLQIFALANNAIVWRESWFRDISHEINRVERLSIVLGLRPNDLGQEFLPLRHVAAPNLLHLEIENRNVRSRPPCPVELFSGGAPKLSSVWMQGFFPFPAPSWMSSLTRFQSATAGQRLDDAAANLYLSALRQPSGLVYLLLDLAGLGTVPTDYQIRIPSLRFLSVWIDIYNQQEPYLLQIMDFFSCPALSELVVFGSHGHQVFSLLNTFSFPRTSFPMLHALSFINTDLECSCEYNMPLPTRTHLVDTPLFPTLSSLTLMKQCFMSDLIREIIGTSPLPLPSLQTLTLRPSPGEPVVNVRHALLDAMLRLPQTLPKLRLSPALYYEEDWREVDQEVTVFDPERLDHALQVRGF